MPNDGEPPRLNDAAGAPTPSHASSESRHSVSSNTSYITANVSNLVLTSALPTVTNLPSTGQHSGDDVPVGTIVIVLMCLLAIVVAVIIIILYLKRTGRLYKIPFKPLKRTSRRSSFSNSERALHMRDTIREDDDCYHDDLNTERLPTPSTTPVVTGRRHNNNKDGAEVEVESATMFAIQDHDMESVDIGDGTSRGTNDEYFYDEVFGKSMFEDEATNASMRQLYLAGEEGMDDVMDVDAIVDSIVGKNSNSAKT